ncbi:MAG TPA: hypothetical protein VLH18_08430, partial [Candidatus Limnocylindrales bacterium]|nr:hypothetical protein [Candidatus Limnocylindrales bacterium]
MNENTIKDILLELSEAVGISGAEMAAIETASLHFKKYTDSVKTDRFGNLFAYKYGETNLDQDKITVAMVAHIDEIGAMVTKIEDEGFLRFTAIGGIDPRILIGQAVEVHGRSKMKGVIGAVPPHLLTDKERTKELKTENLFIDIGYKKEQITEFVSIGDYIALEQEPLFLEDGKLITGKALDNRAGVAALIMCAAELAGLRHQVDVCFIASLQEEVGLRGAVTAAYGLKPDLAVVVDVTHGETPGIGNAEAFKIGGGPALGFGPNLHPVLSKQLQDVARQHLLPYQREP